MSIIKKDRENMAGVIIYIKFSVDYDKFYGCKDNINTADGYKIILKYLTKKWYIIQEEAADDYANLLKIY